MKYRLLITISLLFFGLLWSTGCSGEIGAQYGTVDQYEEGNAMERETAAADMDHMAALARSDLARRLSVDPTKITLLETRRVIWPDTRLGCPRQGAGYEKRPQEGGMIRLRVGNELFFYHWGADDTPFLCENSPLARQPAPDSPGEWVPPPGLDAN